MLSKTAKIQIPKVYRQTARNQQYPTFMPIETASRPIHIEKNPLGDFTFFEDYVVAEWLKSEIDSFDLVKMETVSQAVYGSQVWGYISNRTHATVSNPVVVYQMLQRAFAPMAVAVVTYSMRSRIVAQLEKEYCRAVPIEIFSQLESAKTWMVGQITELKNESEQSDQKELIGSPSSAA